MHHIFVIGTRAQLIKVAPVIKTFEINQLPVIFILTGQHNDTMDDLIQEFNIQTKAINLIKNKEHSSIFALLLWMPYIFIRLIIALKKYTPSYVFVHGDTLTTLFSTITAQLTCHKVVHLESGLTSGKIFTPFPEEIIRRIVFRFTDVACCPHKQDIEVMEKYSNTQILYTYGNTILDSIKYLQIGELIEKKKYTILVSLHRFQNIYNKKRLQEIMNMLDQLSLKYQIIFVLHPATKKKLRTYHLIGELEKNNNIQLHPRMTYQKFLNLALSTDIVITDGGSNQEELAFFGHPTLILREATERPDGIGENALLIHNPQELLDVILKRNYLNLIGQKQELTISPSNVIMQYFKNEGT